MSLGASVAIVARSRCSGVKLRISARARSSSRPSGRQPAFGPDGTRAGFAPMNAGPVTVSNPEGDEKLRER